MKIINDIVIKELNQLGIVKLNEPMRHYTSFRTGGIADILIWPEDFNSLGRILMLSHEAGMPVTVLGGCSNLLVSDDGIRGMTIMINSAAGIKGRMSAEADGLVYADAMIRKDVFLGFCVDSGYEGMEFIAGIPGCMGGGIYMNAGTIHGSFADILVSILSMNEDGEVIRHDITRDMYGYRTMGLPDNAIILGGYFSLKKTEHPHMVLRRIDEFIAERKVKHPLDYPSAGSVFKNPEGHQSWKLIDDAGLKGRTAGGAAVSELHTNFIINKGNATSTDIFDLINLISDVVYSRFQITLETEIKLIGEF